MSGIVQAGAVDYTAIHFSERFPVERTPCGKLGPSAGRWGYVTCIECLRRAPADPRIEARLRELLNEAASREASGR